MVVGMTDEQMRERKARSAQLACIGLLARVNTLVIPKLVRLGKCFEADGTAVGSLVPAVDLLAVLGIRDIFERIRILGSMPLTIGSGSGSSYFRHKPSRRHTKNNFKKSFSPFYFLKVHLHHFSKMKSQKEVTKQGESRFFLLLLGDRRIRIRIHTSDHGSGFGSRRPKNMQILRI
jgi:hypothetical protein